MDRMTKIETIIDDLTSCGSYRNKTHGIELLPGYVVEVRDLRTNALVAYSSTKADLADSIAEFVGDYFV